MKSNFMLGVNGMREKPGIGEHPDWFTGYLVLVPEGDIVETLRNECENTKKAFGKVTEELGDYAYAPGKWSLKEVLGHMADFERIIGYRTICISRGDQTNLAGFDENTYVKESAFSKSTISDLLSEFVALRTANLHMLGRLRAQDWLRTGNVVGNTTSVRALAWVLAGHEIHHRRVVQERYLEAK